jgi:hypothetical protein
VQLALQPSPLIVLPSSHCSPAWMIPSPHFMPCMKAPVVDPVSVVAVVAPVVPVPPEPLVELWLPVLVVVIFDVEQASTSTSGTAVRRRILEKSSITPQ